MPEYLQLYEREGLEIQREILGHLVGYYSTEVGPAVQPGRAPVGLRELRGSGERRRKRLAADPGWQSYLAEDPTDAPEQRNRLMRPAPFFEPELRR